MSKRYFEANVLINHNLHGTIFFVHTEREELDEWVKEQQLYAQTDPSAIIEIYVIEHDHELTKEILSGKTIPTCDCGRHLSPNPYWSSVKLYDGV